jgi:hypothetical protein
LPLKFAGWAVPLQSSAWAWYEAAHGNKSEIISPIPLAAIARIRKFDAPARSWIIPALSGLAVKFV